jgi:hypothetical protein
MKRLMIVLGVALTLGVPAAALAQARPDFSGTWMRNGPTVTSVEGAS